MHILINITIAAFALWIFVTNYQIDSLRKDVDALKHATVQVQP